MAYIKQVPEHYENPRNVGNFDRSYSGAGTGVVGSPTSSGALKLQITEVAAAKIRKHLEKRGKGLGVYIGVKTTGCSGLAYTMEFLDNPNPHCLEHHDVHGVRIFIDPKWRNVLWGTTIDYERNGLNEGFKFTNPNERDRCGCGESFRV